METIREITAWDGSADLGIMYEVTGFQGEGHSDEEFWANYESYKDFAMPTQFWDNEMSLNNLDNAAT